MKKYLIAILFLFVYCSCLYSQNNELEKCDSIIQKNNNTHTTDIHDADLDTLFIMEMKKNEQLIKELDIIKKRKKELISETGIDGKKLKNKIQKMSNDISKKEAQLSKTLQLRATSSYPALNSECDRLRITLGQLKNDTIKLALQLDSLINDLCIAQRNKSELERMQTDLCQKTINNYSAYIGMSLSVITLDSLSYIKAECANLGKTKNIIAFSSNVENILKSKSVYDNAHQVLSSRYDKDKILRSITELKNLIHLSNNQQNDVDLVISQLMVFEEGLKTFKDFILEFNKRRAGFPQYSKEDYDVDFPYILEKNNIKERIKSTIKPVPYLNIKFSEYIKIIEENPLKHPEIETEILNQ